MSITVPEQARQIAKEKLSDERYYHTRCVAQAADDLAKRMGYDRDEAATAAYLHDILKEEDKTLLLQMIEASDIISLDDLRASPPVWHAFAGGEYVEKQLGLPRETANAVRYHTTGRAGMTTLEKIVYLADYISIDRDFRGADEVRKLSVTSIDRAILVSLRNQMCHLAKLGRHINVNTFEAYNYLIDSGVTSE